MNGLEFGAAVVGSVAWPAAVVIVAAILRRELLAAFQRIQSVEFPGGRATFAALEGFEKAIAVATGASDEPPARPEDTEFDVLHALAHASPGEAIMDSWGLLEYQLNVVSDRFAPEQPHGWPQVTRNLEGWGTWGALSPAVAELRRLRDYTVRSPRVPSREDASRYVSLVQELIRTLRNSMPAESVHARQDEVP